MKSGIGQALRLQTSGEEDFLPFSRAVTGRLRDELAKYPSLRTAALVLFCHYRYRGGVSAGYGTEQPEQYMRVNENLDINPTHYL
ncbi:nucleoid-associated protein [Salmonella enterica subsp. enterica]|nr:nucleoid-associated protein [Salmonella enterica subsp. enterica]